MFHNEMCRYIKLLAVKRWVCDLKLRLLANWFMVTEKHLEGGRDLEIAMFQRTWQSLGMTAVNNSK